jgi:hypothetical protein
VRVWFKPVDGRSSAVAMRYDERCPSCGASWVEPFSVRLGGSTVGCQFYCWTCKVTHPEQREEGPDRHP